MTVLSLVAGAIAAVTAIGAATAPQFAIFQNAAANPDRYAIDFDVTLTANSFGGGVVPGPTFIISAAVNSSAAGEGNFDQILDISPVGEDENLIGRSSDCEIPIKEEDISRNHAKLLVQQGRVKVLEPVEKPFVFDSARKPFVILVVGVNGSGKTTTIGKLGAIAVREGFSVTLAVCDTFRAAAIEQLEIWGRRIGATTVSRAQGSDASGLAFDAFRSARDTGSDILIVDTAGRLQNKATLMAELEKIVRVLRKQDETAPHAVLLVLDATTGQNAVSQTEVFQRIAGVTGLVMTKLDGTARGGILVAIADRFKLPVHAIGVGEGIDDLQPFDAQAFARAIAGLEEEVAA
mgnify:CR=1 FL=1